MAMKTEVRYINAYVSGSCVPQPEKMPQKKSSARLPKAQKQQKWLIPVDVVALVGIFAAAVLGISLIVGLVQMNNARQEAKMYKEYALTLQEQNAQLRDTYYSSYDTEEVRQIALQMGMVPVEQVQHLEIEVQEPQQTQQPSGWESFWAFLVGMFA